MPHMILGTGRENETQDNHPCLWVADREQQRSQVDSMSGGRGSVEQSRVRGGWRVTKGRSCDFRQGAPEPLRRGHLHAHLRDGREGAVLCLGRGSRQSGQSLSQPEGG